MDSLSLILTILEGLIVGSVVAASLLALKKLSSAMCFLPIGAKVAYKYLFGAFLLIVSLIDSVIDLIEMQIHKLSKYLSFACKYIKFSAFANFKFIKESFNSYRFRTKSYMGKYSFSRGKPNIREFSGDILSSQSFLRISPIILQ